MVFLPMPRNNIHRSRACHCSTRSAPLQHLLSMFAVLVLVVIWAPSVVASPLEFWDDFSYQTRLDVPAAIWEVRVGGGGPGPSGVRWDANHVTFITDPGDATNRLLRLESSSDGTAANTWQSQLYTDGAWFHEGTYAARVRFEGEQAFGAVGGDEINQAFYAITPSNQPPGTDPNYSELDFEYLANGGWGTPGQTRLYFTSWESVDPRLSQSTRLNQSFDGWRTLVLQVAGGEMKYYVDGNLLGTHGDIYYPESPMSLRFVQYFTAMIDPTDVERGYYFDIDWVYYQDEAVLSPSQIDATVQAFRLADVDAAFSQNLVPEPASALLLLAGSIFMLSRRTPHSRR